MASWFSHIAATLQAVGEVCNPHTQAGQLDGRYSRILRDMRDFHSFWTRERGGSYFATKQEVRLVQSTYNVDFVWVCTQLADSIVGLMYAALVQANNGNRKGFVEKSKQAVGRLDELIKLSTARCGNYQLLRQQWVAFHNSEVRRLRRLK